MATKRSRPADAEPTQEPPRQDEIREGGGADPGSLRPELLAACTGLVLEVKCSNIHRE